ncbi:MAG: type I secretion system permease/ATPase, partial [Alphaproteobacteria bacterium]|nr:type I secretion system permease/ATPase [Alphaproteobacteria bacterium]
MTDNDKPQEENIADTADGKETEIANSDETVVPTDMSSTKEKAAKKAATKKTKKSSDDQKPVVTPSDKEATETSAEHANARPGVDVSSSNEEMLMKIRQAILESKTKKQEESENKVEAQKASAESEHSPLVEQRLAPDEGNLDMAQAEAILAQEASKTAKQPRQKKKPSEDDEEIDFKRATDDRRLQPDRRAEMREGRDRRAGPRWIIKPNTGQNDDPLLGCLTILCAMLDRPISANALTAGLPLEDEGHLTPDLFVRAAERAGISSRMQKTKLDTISRLALPCVVLLKEQRAAVLTKISENGKVTILLPEMGAGAQEVPFEELKSVYIGYAIFARPEFQFDARAKEDRIEESKNWFWGNIFASWRLYLEVMLAAVLINCFAIASPLFVMNVYDRVVPNFAEETLWVLAIGITMVFTFDFILKLLRGYLVDVAGKTADTRIASRLFQQMLGMKMAHRPQSAGALANSMREFESLREFFTSSSLMTLIDLPFILLFLAIVYVIGGPLIAMVPATVVVVVAIVGFLMQFPMQRVVKNTHQEAQQKHAILVEAITGIETIKLAAAESRMQRAWEIFTGRTARSSMLSTRWAQLAMNFSGMSMQMVTVGVVVVGVYLIQEGDLTVGALVACTILSGRALAPLGQIAGIATRFHQAKQALDNLDNMMQTPVERPAGRSFVHRPNFTGHIEFKNVSFSYPEAQTEAVRDVSFSIKAGEKVGLIGRIGSGKSTIEKLVLGLHDPTEGSVMVDGTDTRQLDPADLRRNMGVVAQDVYLFYGTVKENIALGAPYVDD